MKPTKRMGLTELDIYFKTLKKFNECKDPTEKRKLEIELNEMLK